MFTGPSSGKPEEILIWRIFGTMKDKHWHKGQATVPKGTYRLLLELNGDNYRAGIKNITLTNSPCPETSEFFFSYFG